MSRLNIYYLALLLFFMGCSEEIVSPSECNICIPTIYIDDPIVIDASDYISPYNQIDYTYYFNLQDIDFVRDGLCNEIYYTYLSSTSCDTEVNIFQSIDSIWVQISFTEAYITGCVHSPSQDYHLLSSRGLSPQECYVNGFELMLKGDLGRPEIKALRLNPNLYSIPIFPIDEEFVYYSSGLTFDGEHLWITLDWNYFQKIYRLSINGEVLDTFSIPDPPSFSTALAFDGKYIWLAGTENIIKYTQQGDIASEFLGLGGKNTGLAWGDNKLWLMGRFGGIDRIFSIDPVASCDSNRTIIVDTLTVPSQFIGGLAWDGENLLVSSDRLYVIAPSDSVIEDFRIYANNYGRDIAWDGDAVWLLHRGTRQYSAKYVVLSRFLLR